MTRTEAPKDLAGRGEEKRARTTPELPKQMTTLANCNERRLVRSVRLLQTPSRRRIKVSGEFTMWPGDLAPDDADLGSTDFLLSAVDVGNLLAQVEAAGTRVRNRLVHQS